MARTMRESIAAIDAGHKFDAEGEREVEIAAELAEDLSSRVIAAIAAWHREHPEATTVAIIPGAVRAIAILAMAEDEMPPSDFGAFAEAVAEEFQPHARRIRASILNRGKA